MLPCLTLKNKYENKKKENLFPSTENNLANTLKIFLSAL